MANKTLKYRKSERFAEIKCDLLNALERGGASGAHNEDLVDAYMDLWCHYQLLSDDINKRGILVEYHNGGGQKGKKRNESIGEEVKVSAQMLKIREAIGIKDIPSDGEDDEL